MKALLFNKIYRNLGKFPNFIKFMEGKKNIGEIFDLSVNLTDIRSKLYKNTYKFIGETPCYTVYLPNNNTLRIKMECLNPMGNSHYARYWIPYLFIAEELQIIKPFSSHIIDVTSGSAGIALAIAANKLGYDSTIIVPRILPQSRIKPMIENKANVLKVDGYIGKCIDKLIDIIDSNGFFPSNHSEEKSDFITHVFSRIAYEYINQYDYPDYAIIGLGNGTTTYSIFKQFKKSLKTNCISYHPHLEKEQIVFGLYGPNVKLRHVDIADKITDKKVYTNNINLNIVFDYFKNDTEINSLGASSLYAIAIALEVSRS